MVQDTQLGTCSPTQATNHLLAACEDLPITTSPVSHCEVDGVAQPVLYSTFTFKMPKWEQQIQDTTWFEEQNICGVMVSMIRDF